MRKILTMVQAAQTMLNQNLQSLPSLSQFIRSNATYVNITTVRLYPNGTVTQSLQIIKKSELNLSQLRR